MTATDQEPYNPEPRIRRVYVYRLKIEYPEGSFKPGWRPANWLDPMILSQMSSLQRWRHRRSEFRWPRERMFLSASSANDRAWILRACGAKVEIQRSQQVLWDADVSPERAALAFHEALDLV